MLRAASIFALIVGATFCTNANAFLFLFLLSNVSKPAPLNTLIEAMEKSEETKALAFVSEDKSLRSRHWVWGHFEGRTTQADADREAMSRCLVSLESARSEKVGGKAVFDFGRNTCELYRFSNKPVLLPDADPALSAAAMTATTGTSAGDVRPRGVDPTSSVEASAAASQPQAIECPSPANAARRLKELGDLHRDGLITEAEYDERRRAILAAM